MNFLLTPFFKLFSIGGFFFKIVSNFSILKSSFENISAIFKKMHDENRAVPTEVESVALLQIASDLLKTGIVDIPGFDEYELSMDIDKYANALVLSIEDKKSGKYHDVKISKIMGDEK